MIIYDFIPNYFRSKKVCDLLDCNLKGKDLKVLQFKVDKLDRASLYKVSAVRGDVVKLPIISKNTNRKSGIVTVLVDDSVKLSFELACRNSCVI